MARIILIYCLNKKLYISEHWDKIYKEMLFIPDFIRKLQVHDGFVDFYIPFSNLFITSNPGFECADHDQCCHVYMYIYCFKRL